MNLMLSNLDQFEQPTRFVGRETELYDTAQLLENPGCRLLTLVGVGGIGKTRLAIELAKSQLPAFTNGVWFVNLQPIQSGEHIASATIDALSLAPSGHDSPESQLLQYLQEKHILLVLDNFENVLDGAEFLTRMLRQASGLKLLVTSRETLGLPEEKLYPIAGLPTPTSHQAHLAETNTSVKLFVERARQIRPDFSLDDERASVVRICQLVDGLPLAIEMAASWTKTLRCAEIAAEIQQNLNFLTLNLRHRPERHRSMQAVFTQTWGHLTEDEQGLFKRLTIFRAGFRREAAESIAGATLYLLSSLLDKCLLRREGNGRYQIHELLRQFAYSKLDDSEKEALTEAHCLYYCDFLARHRLGLVEKTQVETSIEVESELENIRTAWRVAVARKKVVALREAAAPYFDFCQLQSRYAESAEASEQALAVCEEAGDVEGGAQILVYQAWILIRLGRFEQAAEGLGRSRALFEELQLTPARGMGSHPLAPLVILNVVQGDYENAITLGEQLKEESAARGDHHNGSFACYGLTSAYLNQGQIEAALKNGEQAVKLAEDIQSHWFSGYCHIELGNVHKASGHLVEAERHYRISLRIKQNYRDPEGIAVTVKHLGEISLQQGDYPAARELFEQSLSIYQDLNDEGGLATAYHGLGQVEYLAGAGGLAVQHFQAALEIAGRINFIPLLLSLLIDIGALMLGGNLNQRGLELLRLVCDHPTSSKHQKEKAASLLSSLAGSNKEMNDRSVIPDFDKVLNALQSEMLDFTPVEKRQAPIAVPDLLDPLTERELDVLRLIVQGRSNPEIAEKLFLSVGTVKAHTNRIYGKLGVANRVEAVLKAQESGLLTGRPV